MLKDTIELINKDLSEAGELNKSNTYALIDLMAAVNAYGINEPKAAKAPPPPKAMGTEAFITTSGSATN